MFIFLFLTLKGIFKPNYSPTLQADGSSVFFLCIYLFVAVLALAPTPGLLPGESQGRGSPVGCSPWGREESDTTERLHFHFALSCIGEGNSNPLQCSCLENPRDGGAWWAAVCGVAQSRTRLKRLSSSSSSTGSCRLLSSWCAELLIAGPPLVAELSAVAASGLSSGSSWALEHRLSSCDAWI